MLTTACVHIHKLIQIEREDAYIQPLVIHASDPQGIK